MAKKNLPARAVLLSLLKGRTVTIEFANPAGLWEMVNGDVQAHGLPEELEGVSPLALLDALRCLVKSGLATQTTADNECLQACRNHLDRLYAAEDRGEKIFDSDIGEARDAVAWYEDHPTRIFSVAG